MCLLPCGFLCFHLGTAATPDTDEKRNESEEEKLILGHIKCLNKYEKGGQNSNTENNYDKSLNLRGEASLFPLRQRLRLINERAPRGKNCDENVNY